MAEDFAFFTLLSAETADCSCRLSYGTAARFRVVLLRVAPTAKYVDRSGNSGISYYSTHNNVPTITPSGFTVITDRVAKIVFSMPSGVTMALGDYVYANLTLDAEIY